MKSEYEHEKMLEILKNIGNEYLNKYGDPYMKILIDIDGIKICRIEKFEPIKKIENLKIKEEK